MLDSDNLPVGRHKWLMENNVCQEGKTSNEILQMSGCREDQLTCVFRCLNLEVGD